jgi:hypothetical protein
MSRYIKIEDLQKFPIRKDHYDKVNGSIKYVFGVEDVLEYAEYLPTYDVVEVVRCKDCKHNVANWQHDELDIEDYTDIVCDYFMTDGMEANDYCSHGERRDDNEG